MDTRGTVTVIVVEPTIVPAVALIVVAPTLSVFTMPTLPAALLTVATEGEDELQITDCSGYVLPSLKVPVALRTTVCPMVVGFGSEVVIEVS